MTRALVVRARLELAVAWGALIGTLGGLIGLGGAEFRLPVLIGFFRYPTAQAIVINLMVSLVTVVFSFLFRTGLAGLGSVQPHLPVVLNLIVGTLIGAYLGTHLASRVGGRALTRVVSLWLIALSFLLIAHDLVFHLEAAVLADLPRFIVGVIAGVVIGTASSLLGVAGGELIIPTLILLFGIDVKIAGSLSLLVSIPTILAGLLRYRALRRFEGLSQHGTFIGSLAVGSIIGALVGSVLVRYAPGALLTVLLGIILLISAVRLFTRPGDHA